MLQRTRLCLNGLYKRDGEHLAQADILTDPADIIDHVIIGLDFDPCALYLYFLRRDGSGFAPGWRTPTYWLYDNINPFRERDIVKDREWVYNLVDNCLRSDFWGGRPCPLNNADVEAIRAILYDKIDRHPYLN